MTDQANTKEESPFKGRIYYLGFLMLDPPTGGAVHFLGLAKAMGNRGVDLVPVVPRQSLPAKLADKSCICLPFLDLPMLRVFSFQVCALFWLIFRVRGQDGPRMIYTRGGMSLITRIARWFNLPVYVELNAILSNELAGDSLMRRLHKWLVVRQDRTACKKATGVVAVSESVAQQYATDILGIQPLRIAVIHNGADPEHFSPKLADHAKWNLGKGPVLGFVGNLAPWVELKPFLEGLACLRKQGGETSDFQFVIAGDGPEAAPLKELVQSLNLSACVQFLGYVPHKDVPSLMASFDIGVFCYVKSRGASSPLKAFEYLASGCVPLTYRDLEMNWFAEHDCGVLVERDEPEKIAETLDELFKDPKRMARMKETARDYFLNHWTWERTAKRTLSFFSGKGSPDTNTTQEKSAPNTADNKRVVLVITRMIRGGAPKVALAQAQGLRAQGIEVTFVTGMEEGREGSILEEVRNEGFEVEEVPAMVRSVHPAKDIMALWKIYRCLRRKRPLLVHTHTSKAGIIGRTAAYLARVPYIVHSNHGHIYRLDGSIPGVSNRPFLRRLFFQIERMVTRWTDRVYTLTTLDADEQAHLGLGPRSRFTTLHNGVKIQANGNHSTVRDEMRKTLEIIENKPIFGCVGRLSSEKGYDILLDAFKIVCKTHPDAVLVIAGDGEDGEALKDRSQKNGTEKSVHFLGLRDDVERLYAAFDIFVTSPRYEGFGISIAEAMAAGVPVVATQVGGIPEVVEHEKSGLLVLPGDTEKLAAAMCKLADDADLCAKLKKGALKRVETYFSTEVMQEQLYQYYQELWHDNTGIV